jgi:hypothetical protein
MNLAEKFDEAKRLKQALSELYKIGERLARYDIEKRQAIQDEDYEKAKTKKLQMQEYRAETYKQLQKHNLLGLIDVSCSCLKIPRQSVNHSLKGCEHLAELYANVQNQTYVL